MPISRLSMSALASQSQMFIWMPGTVRTSQNIIVHSHSIKPYSIANSTGVYSGVVASGNGNMNDASNIVSSRL